MGKPSLEIGLNISHPASASEEGGKDSKNHQRIKGPHLWAAHVVGSTGQGRHITPSGKEWLSEFLSQAIHYVMIHSPPLRKISSA